VPDISVIIPAFNEARYLPRLLATLDAARARYRGGAGRVEVIVADNGSADDTVAIAQERGCTVVSVEPRVIAAVRNAGARAARGDILAFVDADTQLHPGSMNAVADFFADPARVFAVTGVVPERRSPAIDLTWLLFAPITAMLGFGAPTSLARCVATGMVCCRRADWLEVDGYDERLLFAEDVRFIVAMKRLGRRRGQKVGWLADVPAVFSTRKFDEHGDWHYVTMPARLLAGLLWWPGLRRWVERYWYGEQRGPVTRHPS
jgi:glycosyltransferase involved in cell wall biosynthesis